MASMALAIVLAVYMPPQAPAPGHAFRTMSCLYFSSIRPAAYAPAWHDIDCDMAHATEIACWPLFGLQCLCTFVV